MDTIVEELSVPLNGASLSAQVHDSTGAPSEIRGTETVVIDGTEGAYKIYLPITQDIFNNVATMDDFLPECQVLDASIDGVRAYENFNLTLSPVDAYGTFKASVSVQPSDTDSASFSIRQTLGDCGVIEVASRNVIISVDPTSPVYFNAIFLPVGAYDLIVEPTDGQKTKTLPISVAADLAKTVLDVVYP